MKEEFDALAYVFYVWIFGSLAALIFKGEDSFKDVLWITSKRHFLFLLLTGLSFWTWHVMSLTSLKLGWDVAIVYKVISYSLIFPIIYSIIFYNEKVTVKKMIAFIISLVSIWLFV